VLEVAREEGVEAVTHGTGGHELGAVLGEPGWDAAARGLVALDRALERRRARDRLLEGESRAGSPTFAVVQSRTPMIRSSASMRTCAG
jgi:hypothetical protein